jgi:hypothetical protein
MDVSNRKSFVSNNTIQQKKSNHAKQNTNLRSKHKQYKHKGYRGRKDAPKNAVMYNGTVLNCNQPTSPKKTDNIECRRE